MNIHFFNFMNFIERDNLASYTLESWQKFAAGHNIKVWTEKDKEIQEIFNKSNFCKRMLELYNYDKVFEICKLYILYEFGGLAVELDQPIFSNLQIDKVNFFSHWCATSWGPQGVEKGHPLITKILSYYEQLSSECSDFEWGFEGNAFFSLPKDYQAQMCYEFSDEEFRSKNRIAHLADCWYRDRDIEVCRKSLFDSGIVENNYPSFVFLNNLFVHSKSFKNVKFNLEWPYLCPEPTELLEYPRHLSEDKQPPLEKPNFFKSLITEFS